MDSDLLCDAHPLSPDTASNSSPPALLQSSPSSLQFSCSSSSSSSSNLSSNPGPAPSPDLHNLQQQLTLPTHSWKVAATAETRPTFSAKVHLSASNSRDDGHAQNVTATEASPSLAPSSTLFSLPDPSSSQVEQSPERRPGRTARLQTCSDHYRSNKSSSTPDRDCTPHMDDLFATKDTDPQCRNTTLSSSNPLFTEPALISPGPSSTELEMDVNMEESARHGSNDIKPDNTDDKDGIRSNEHRNGIMSAMVDQENRPPPPPPNNLSSSSRLPNSIDPSQHRGYELQLESPPGQQQQRQQQQQQPGILSEPTAGVLGAEMDSATCSSFRSLAVEASNRSHHDEAKGSTNLDSDPYACTGTRIGSEWR
ncbi:hypothetical protein BGW38_004181 [Lunasporangiospora selenospora]|uniref:Uncharacterized protein n=1 Tax=Lunasporangiospora selenospora TaxID=979761 RepID=A0A9P6FQ50_9FUNG|nr:hypothetical protein BGW38_004181 [Lunasporangiospora selenospora]